MNHVTQKKEDAVIEIEGEEESSSTIVRKLISLYFLGYKTINVKPKNGQIKCSSKKHSKRSCKANVDGF